MLRWFETTRAGLSPELTRVAADVVVGHVRVHRAMLSQPLLRALRDVVAADEIAELAAWVPPPVPATLPAEPDAVLRWVTEQYLPYRAWQVLHGDAGAADVSRAHAQAFAAWVCAAPQRLSGTAHPYQHLYWTHSTRAQPLDAQEVVFWVIADGLGWLDARRVAQRVDELSRGVVTTTDAVPCFGLLPTITHFTKDALRAGLPYKQLIRQRATALADAAADVGDTRDPVTVLAAATGGSRVVWKPLKPDKVYHEKGDAAVVRRSAQAALDQLAGTIWAAVAGVPKDRAVRVLLTTDHGRLLSEGRRDVPVPSGFSSHGRVVYRVLDAPGPEPEPHPAIEWLSPEWFDLPDWVGVVRDERSFNVLRDDGTQQSGRDNFQHGGLWPEEVVVPWLTLVRDAEPVRLTGQVAGRARPGQWGTLRVQLINSTARPVRIRMVRMTGLSPTPVELPVDVTLGALQTEDLALTLPDWPTQLQTANVRTEAVVALPDGQEASFPLATTLTSDEMQIRPTDILGDL